MKRLLLLCFLAGCAQPLIPATYPKEPAYRVLVSTEADRELQALTNLTRATRKEQALCVTLWAIVHEGGERFAFALLRVGPSRPYHSDSLKVWTVDGQGFCPDSMPNVHTHVVQNAVWGRPSDFDIQVAENAPSPPFRVLVSVKPLAGAVLTLYAIR